MEYSLGNAEKTVLNVVDITAPIVIKFEDPINRIDDFMCKSLDVVVQKVPIVTYTPEEVNIFILLDFRLRMHVARCLCVQYFSR